MKARITEFFGAYPDRVILFAAGSAVLNFASAAVNLVCGITSCSFWFTVHAAYYTALVFVRVYAILTYIRIRRHKDAKQTEYRFYKRSGAFIFIIASAYFLICVYTVHYGNGNSAKDGAIYGAAFIALYKLSFSAYGLYITKKMKSRVAETLKTVSLTDASVSLVTVQYAALDLLGKRTAVSDSAAFGMAVSAVFMVTGAVMTVKRYRKNE